MISIISMGFNQRHYTEMFLKSLSDPNCADMPFELVFIDNGSDDGSAELIKQYDLKKNPNFINLIYFAFETNQGVAAAINKAVDLAKREIILQADNDVIFGPGSLSVLNHWRKLDPTAVISPNWPWIQKKLGTSFFKSPQDLGPHKLKQLRRVGMHAPLERFRATGSCWMATKNLFDQIGGWDTGYKNICASDDFLMKVAISGVQRMTVPCPVYHPGKVTRTTIAKNGEQQQRDMKRFQEKWGGHPEDKGLFRQQQIKAGVAPDPILKTNFWQRIFKR